ncbi:unnamed protein product [Dibothriocephalus latus]|uniref:Uncharacterized protein n=1 Tax=Dibothriocephalus latus TaxID=60516 RepID=A0A3P7MC96_DIBLA|nr:unnamed protein product [Dibothriocephalus latus]
MESGAASVARASVKSDKRRHYVEQTSIDERAVQVHSGRFVSSGNSVSPKHANNAVADSSASLGCSLIYSADACVQQSDTTIDMTQSDIVLTSNRQISDSGGAVSCPQNVLPDSPSAVSQPGSSALSFSIPSTTVKVSKGRILSRCVLIIMSYPHIDIFLDNLPC